MKHRASRIRTEILQPNTSPPVLPPVLQNFSPGFQGHFLRLGRRGVPLASVIDRKCGFAAHLASQWTRIDLITSVWIYLDLFQKKSKKRLPIVRLAVF